MDEGAPHAAAGPSHDQPHIGHGILSFPLIRLRILAACRNLSQIRKQAVPSLDLADTAASARARATVLWLSVRKGLPASILPASITSLNSAVVNRSSAASKSAPGSSLSI